MQYESPKAEVISFEDDVVWASFPSDVYSQNAPIPAWVKTTIVEGT